MTAPKTTEQPLAKKPKKNRVLRFLVQANARKEIEKAIAMRTSALCRDDEGLILPNDLMPEKELFDSGEFDEEGAALAAICRTWLQGFNRETLAELRNGKPEE